MVNTLLIKNTDLSTNLSFHFTRKKWRNLWDDPIYIGFNWVICYFQGLSGILLEIRWIVWSDDEFFSRWMSADRRCWQNDGPARDERALVSPVFIDLMIHAWKLHAHYDFALTNKVRPLIDSFICMSMNSTDSMFNLNGNLARNLNGNKMAAIEWLVITNRFYSHNILIRRARPPRTSIHRPGVEFHS